MDKIKQWEYEIAVTYVGDSDEVVELNEFGIRGWELVSSYQVINKDSPSKDATFIKHIFKRPCGWTSKR